MAPSIPPTPLNIPSTAPQYLIPDTTIITTISQQNAVSDLHISGSLISQMASVGSSPNAKPWFHQFLLFASPLGILKGSWGCNSEPSPIDKGHRPVISEIPNLTVKVGEDVRLEVDAKDDDGDDLRYRLTKLDVTAEKPDGSSEKISVDLEEYQGYFDSEEGILSFNAKQLAGENDTVTIEPWFQITDGIHYVGQGGKITILPASLDSQDSGVEPNPNPENDAGSPPPPQNEAPELLPIGNKSVQRGSHLSIVLSATDPESDSLTYSSSGLPSGATFSPTSKTFSWTPLTAGIYDGIRFYVSDGKLEDSETISINVLNTILDKDGDGFKEDVDCDDDDPNTIPLRENGTTTIGESKTICGGTYQSAELIISGNNLTVNALGLGGFLQDGWLYLNDLSNSSVSDIHVLNASGHGPDLWFSYAINLENANFNNLQYLTGDCGQNDCDMPIFLNSSKGNTISNSTFSDAVGNGCGMTINSESDNNDITSCTFNNNPNDICDSGSGNTFSNITYQ